MVIYNAHMYVAGVYICVSLCVCMYGLVSSYTDLYDDMAVLT